MALKQLLPLIPVLGLSLALGYLVNRASSCGVSAVKHWRDHGRLDRILGLLLAAGGAAVAILILQRTSQASHRPEAALPLAFVVCGAIAAGMGAVLNDACLLGSLSRLGDGEVRFLLIIPGLALGFWMAEVLRPGIEHAFALTDMMAALPIGQSARLAMAALVATALWLVWPWSVHGPDQHWPIRWSMPLLGMVGGALFCLFPGWSYSDAIHSAVHEASSMKDVKLPPLAMACIAALVTGAMVSGLRNGRMPIRLPALSEGLRSFAGAFLMGLGGAFAGGGNDHLLLWALPHFVLSAVLAYAIMTGTIVLLIWLGRPAGVSTWSSAQRK